MLAASFAGNGNARSSAARKVTPAAGVLPKLTDVPLLTKSKPRMSTTVPPVAGPVCGENESANGESKLNWPMPVAQLPALPWPPNSCAVHTLPQSEGSSTVAE